MVTDGHRRNQREADLRAYEAQRRREQDSYLAEREARLMEQERLKAQAAQRMHDVSVEHQSAETAIIQAIGVDAWEGYKALRGCNPERAYALAGAAATSRNRYRQLAPYNVEGIKPVLKPEKWERMYADRARWDAGIRLVNHTDAPAMRLVTATRRRDRLDRGGQVGRHDRFESQSLRDPGD